MQIGLGEILSLSSAAAWAVGVILYRRLGDTLPPLRLNFLKNLLVLAVLVPATVLIDGFALPSLSVREWVLVTGSGVLGIAVADTLYFGALNALGAGRMGIIGNLYSPLVVVLSFVVLDRSEEHTSELQSLMRISYAVFCLKKKKNHK